MNNLPKNITQFDGKEEVKLELPICVYCDKTSTEDNPVKEWRETGEMVCKDCRHSFVDQEFEEEFPKKPLPEFERLMKQINEGLMPF